jgi:hypothetical protein
MLIITNNSLQRLSRLSAFTLFTTSFLSASLEKIHSPCLFGFGSVKNVDFDRDTVSFTSNRISFVDYFNDVKKNQIHRPLGNYHLNWLLTSRHRDRNEAIVAKYILINGTSSVAVLVAGFVQRFHLTFLSTINNSFSHFSMFRYSDRHGSRHRSLLPRQSVRILFDAGSTDQERQKETARFPRASLRHRIHHS